MLGAPPDPLKLSSATPVVLHASAAPPAKRVRPWAESRLDLGSRRPRVQAIHQGAGREPSPPTRTRDAVGVRADSGRKQIRRPLPLSGLRQPCAGTKLPHRGPPP